MAIPYLKETYKLDTLNRRMILDLFRAHALRL